MSGKSASADVLRAGGRLLGVGVSGNCLIDEEARVLAAVAPAAIVLFARNVESTGQLVDLIGSIREVSDPAPVMMIDEEGGRVDRLRQILPGIPAASDFGTCEDIVVSREFGRVIGGLLAHFDIEVNLAPVVDLWRDGLSPSLVGRCFGTSAQSVAERAGAFIAGMAEHGVLSCLKHFPGLGVAATDPHHAASVVDLSLDELERGDLAPYRMLGSMAPSVMVSHAIYPKVDESGLPGTLSHFVSTTLLRDRLGYAGLAMTDDMEMHAVSDVAGAEDIAGRSLLAGNDLILFCGGVGSVESIAARLGNLTTSEASRERCAEARSRVDTFVRQCGDWAIRRQTMHGRLDDVRVALEGLTTTLPSA